MKCPQCGGAALVRDRRDLPYAYKGETTIIAAVSGQYCPRCDECLPDPDEEERISAEALAFNKTVNAGLIDPEEIIAARQALQLGQREASLLFGGGVNAFNRYEAGKIKPPRALVLLLRLLRNHPGLLRELRNESPRAPHAGSVCAVQEPARPVRARRPAK